MKRFIMILTMAFAMSSCNRITDYSSEKPEIEKRIRSCIGWAGKKDLAR